MKHCVLGRVSLIRQFDQMPFDRIMNKNNQITITLMCRIRKSGPITDQAISFLIFIKWRDVMFVAIYVLQTGPDLHAGAFFFLKKTCFDKIECTHC